jgi:hypothetical protein
MATKEIDMSDVISNQEDLIDSRDIIARIEELRNMRESFGEDNEIEEDYPGWGMSDEGEDIITWYNWDYSDEGVELHDLLEFETECSNFSEWEDGLTFIRDGYFDEYAQDLAGEIYGIDINVWPFSCIDWDDAADKLKDDYTTVDFGSEQYWVRSY